MPTPIESSRVSREPPLKNESGQRTEPSPRRAAAHNKWTRSIGSTPSLRNLVGFAVAAMRVGQGRDPLWANDLPPHGARAMAPQSAYFPLRCGPTLSKSVLFRRSIVEIPSRNKQLGATHSVRVRGERRPLRREVVPQLPVGVDPRGGVAPPRLSLLCGRSRPESEKGTRRGQRPTAAMSLPTHPPLSPLIRISANKIGPAPRSLWVGLRVEIRGGSDAPSAGECRPSAVDVCPCGDVAPPSC
jgi:hypothetical protein